MILDLTKNESHATMLIQGPKKDKPAAKPGDAQQIKPDIVECQGKSDK
jgi:hypothetical protein